MKIQREIVCSFPRKFRGSEIEKLENETSLSRPIIQILLSRGYETAEEIGNFLHPSLANLLDPFIFCDMDKATDRIIKAIKEKEPILVYGDYDVDGISSVVLVLRNLRSLGGEVFYYVPNRLTEGYGINESAIRGISERGFKLVITVDCGINSEPEIKLAKELGMDVIVTDHHIVKEKLQSAYAVLNPRTENEKYPFKDLAGVGVSFKLLSGIFKKMKRYDEIFDDLDLVALGTIADVVSMTGENRILAGCGIDVLNHTKKVGILALLEKSGSRKEHIGTYEIGYVLGPRLNASGRLDTARTSIELLLTNDRSKAWEYATMLDQKNKMRQALCEKVRKESIEIIEKENYDEIGGGIVLAKEDWHEGVVGITASRIARMYSKPTILISTAGEFGKGSGRSVNSFSLLDALDSCKDYLLRYGGHRYAAGLTIDKERIVEFREAFNEVVRETLKDENLKREIVSEAELSFTEINKGLISELKQFEPFGTDNPEPIFITTNAEFVGYPRVVGNGHLKLKVRSNGVIIDAIAFGKGYEVDEIIIGKDVYNICYYLRENNYGGRKTAQLILQHIEKNA